MSDKNPHAPKTKALPASLPIFPLGGVLLLPFGHLPLNIFEPRYLKMVDDALAGDRLIGMIQPRESNGDLYTIGCAGKITEFTETEDGRYLIALTGISRFCIEQEIDTTTPYRQISADWNGFGDDLDNSGCLGLDRYRLTSLLQRYFKHQGMDCDWGAIEDAPEGRLITCLAMVCPFAANEKQALLEAPSCKERAELFMTMLDLEVRSHESGDKQRQH